MLPLCSSNARVLLHALARDALRLDGRSPRDYRRISISFKDGYGNVEISLGRTRCICNVTAAPFALVPTDRAAEGEVSFRVSMAPSLPAMAAELTGATAAAATAAAVEGSSKRQRGSSAEMEKEIERILKHLLRDSGVVDTEALCIQVSKWAWHVRVCVTILDDDGNLMDACMLAAVCGLLHFRKHAVSFEKGEAILHSAVEREPLPLCMHHLPVLVSFSFFPPTSSSSCSSNSSSNSSATIHISNSSSSSSYNNNGGGAATKTEEEEATATTRRGGGGRRGGGRGDTPTPPSALAVTPQQQQQREGSVWGTDKKERPPLIIHRETRGDRLQEDEDEEEQEENILCGSLVFVVDPSAPEEAVLPGRISVAVSGQGELCGIYKVGGPALRLVDIQAFIKMATQHATKILSVVNAAAEEEKERKKRMQRANSISRYSEPCVTLKIPSSRTLPASDAAAAAVFPTLGQRAAAATLHTAAALSLKMVAAQKETTRQQTPAYFSVSQPATKTLPTPAVTVGASNADPTLDTSSQTGGGGGGVNTNSSSGQATQNSSLTYSNIVIRNSQCTRTGGGEMSASDASTPTNTTNTTVTITATAPVSPQPTSPPSPPTNADVTLSPNQGGSTIAPCKATKMSSAEYALPTGTSPLSLKNKKARKLE